MNTILIAGAGQLGSRHLQGVKASKHSLDIWVYDLNKDSLMVAKERYDQVTTETAKDVHFVTSLESVPHYIDIVIVASSSKPRATIIKQVLDGRQVKSMVLEKFLFTRMDEYEEIETLLQERGVKTWVNCPRRMWDGYDFVRGQIDTTLPIEFKYEGGEWGMCCNTIHFVDILMYLTGESEYTLSIDKVIPEVIESKRSGYVELLGTEEFQTPKGSKMTLTSLKKFEGVSRVVIKNGDKVIEYFEGKGEIFINGTPHIVPVHYQSGLSGILVDELIDGGSCRLSSYEISSSYHKNYLSVVAPFINKIKGWTSDSCPIT